MPGSEPNPEECDARDGDSPKDPSDSTGDDLIIIIKFTFLVAFRFQIIKFNNFRPEND